MMVKETKWKKVKNKISKWMEQKKQNGRWKMGQKGGEVMYEPGHGKGEQ